jgi:predicted DNA-binding antitoxin AbrB/MazE fold protein
MQTQIMFGEIPAIYENGRLRLLHQPDLSENEPVRVIILPQEPADESDEIIRMMVRAGLIHPHRYGHSPPPDPVSREERGILAEKLGHAPGRTLSEIIISEREQ